MRPTPPSLPAACPASNTTTVDLLAALRVIGDPARHDGPPAAGHDNTAYSAPDVAPHDGPTAPARWPALDTAETGLRTACLDRVATTKLSKKVTTLDGDTVALTAATSTRRCRAC